MSALRLVAFTAAALPVIEPWFDDADTRQWLSDRRWPAMILFSLTSVLSRKFLLTWSGAS